MNKEKVKDFIESKGYEVEYRSTYKGEGIVIGVKGINTRPILYYENMAFDGLTDEEIGYKLIGIAEENMPNEDFDVSTLINWDNVKDKLRICARMRPSLYDDVLVDTFYDIEEYARIMVKAPNSDDEASVVITNSIRDSLGVSKKKIFEQAIKNTHDDFVVQTLASTIMDIAEEVAENTNDSILFVSTKSGNHGAGAIFDLDLLSDISDRVGGDFYILPSSIHELLVLPAYLDINANDLRTMVKDVNNTQVAENERLSYSVFYYDYKNKCVRKAG